MTVMQFWKYDMQCADMFFICIASSWCYFYSTLFVGLHCCFGREARISQRHFYKSSMHTRICWFNGFGMCWVEADLCYMHLGLTLPACSVMIGQKWPYIPHVHDFMCGTLYVRLMCCMPLHGCRWLVMHSSIEIANEIYAHILFIHCFVMINFNHAGLYWKVIGWNPNSLVRC